MACIISVNIIYYLSKRINNKQLLLLGVGAYAISLVCSTYYGAFDSLLSDRLAHYHAAFSAYFMPANSFIVALIYIVLGKIIAEDVHNNKKRLNKKQNIVWVFLVALIGMIEAYFLRWSVSISDAFLFLPFFAGLSLMLLLRTRVNLSSSVSKMLRSMSILIYILHPIFIEINPVLFGIDKGMEMYIITLIESIFMAWLIISLSSKILVLKNLY